MWDLSPTQLPTSACMLETWISLIGAARKDCQPCPLQFNPGSCLRHQGTIRLMMLVSHIGRGAWRGCLMMPYVILTEVSQMSRPRSTNLCCVSVHYQGILCAADTESCMLEWIGQGSASPKPYKNEVVTQEITWPCCDADLCPCQRGDLTSKARQLLWQLQPRYRKRTGILYCLVLAEAWRLWKYHFGRW